jgi:hypothetical protein
MKFSELPDKQTNALIEFYARITDICSQEARSYSLAGFRLLLLGNSAGVAFLATTLAGLYTANASREDLILPLILFLVGVLFAGLAYLPVIGVASNAAKHIGESVEKFIKDELDLEELQGWGHTKFTMGILRGCILVSLGCLLIGVGLSVVAIL